MTKGPRSLGERLVALVLDRLPPRERGEVAADLEELRAARRARDGALRAGAYYWWQIAGYALRPGAPGMRRGGGMRSWGHELAHGARRLKRAPIFATVSVCTIAVAIAGFTSVFSVVDAVLLEEPAYDQPDELVWVWRRYWYGLERGWLAGPDVSGLRDHADVFDGVVAVRTGQANLTGRAGTAPRRVATMLASANLFEVLGVSPTRGRGFLPEEDRPGAPVVAVLGHDLWVSQFARDTGIVGQEIYLNGQAVRVVGIAPHDFHFVQHSSLGEPNPADLYLPLQVDLALENPGNGAYAGLARVADGVPAARVAAAVDAVARVTDDLFGNPGLEMWSVPLKEDLVGGVRPALLSLMASAGFLLLILGANLATLLIGRANVRDRELAVRSALGAPRGRLLQSVIAESVVLAGAGAVIGLGLSVVGIDLIRALAPEGLPRLWAVGMDLSVVLAALTATAMMALAAGVMPALRGVRMGLANRLREGGARAGGGRVASRTRSTLVVVQVALCLMLVTGAGLLGRAFQDLLAADPGFDGANVLTFAVPLDPSRYTDVDDVIEFDGRFREEVAAIPGVTAVGASNSLPLSARTNQRNVSFPGAPGNTGDEEEDSPLIDEFLIGVGYVEAAGLRLLRGRTFSVLDDGAAPQVALIDDLLAARFFGEADPVGARAQLGSDTVVIVGVVDQARQYRVDADDRPQVYRPLAQRATRGLEYALRHSGDAAAVWEGAREALARVDRALPVGRATTLEEIVRGSLGRERLSLTLILAFALGAVTLASLGIYGIVSNTVVHRTHEIGVRLALGAERSRVVGMVVGQGLRLSGWGVLIGLAGALSTAGLLGTVVAGAGRADPLVISAVAIGLMALAGLASWIPARRATRIEPVEALRPE